VHPWKGVFELELTNGAAPKIQGSEEEEEKKNDYNLVYL